jgi:hypothetical protein
MCDAAVIIAPCTRSRCKPIKEVPRCPIIMLFQKIDSYLLKPYSCINIIMKLPPKRPSSAGAATRHSHVSSTATVRHFYHALSVHPFVFATRALVTPIVSILGGGRQGTVPRLPLRPRLEVFFLRGEVRAALVFRLQRPSDSSTGSRASTALAQPKRGLLLPPPQTYKRWQNNSSTRARPRFRR